VGEFGWAQLVAAARQDRLVWLGVSEGPAARNRPEPDSLWELLSGDGIRPGRQIAIDETWSALRFRPA
jgi:hypothetical protein